MLEFPSHTDSYKLSLPEWCVSFVIALCELFMFLYFEQQGGKRDPLGFAWLVKIHLRIAMPMLADVPAS